MTLSELLTGIRNRLSQASGDSILADAEAVSIIGQTLNIAKERLYLDGSVAIDTNDIDRINTIVERRLSGEPLQYIFGKAYFYDREFFVGRDVLIPRPDTEILVDTVINSEKKRPAMFIDIGVGSGVLTAVLTAHCPEWAAVAVDISFKALRTASRNLFGDGGVERYINPPVNQSTNINKPSDNQSIDKSVNHQPINKPPDSPVNKNIYLLCGDMLDAIKPGKRFDFIVSNPPYISSPQMETLDKSVAAYEPRLALCGGADGLDYYRAISACAGRYLKDTGRLYLEIGFDQGVSVPEILRGGGWKGVAVIKDLAGRDRVAVAGV